jgi:hypothetical protein
MAFQLSVDQASGGEIRRNRENLLIPTNYVDWLELVGATADISHGRNATIKSTLWMFGVVGFLFTQGKSHEISWPQAFPFSFFRFLP